MAKDFSNAFVPGDSHIDAALAVALGTSLSQSVQTFTIPPSALLRYVFLYLWLVCVCATLAVEKVSTGGILAARGLSGTGAYEHSTF